MIEQTSQGDYRCTVCGTRDLGAGGMHLSKRYANGVRYARGYHTEQRCRNAAEYAARQEEDAARVRLRNARRIAADRLIDMLPDDDQWRAAAEAIMAEYRRRVAA